MPPKYLKYNHLKYFLYGHQLFTILPLAMTSASISAMLLSAFVSLLQNTISGVRLTPSPLRLPMSSDYN
ncbi:MAG: hypothetical protein ABSE54_09725 [Smithella sp.]|jgi:hypothetical protein